METILPVVSAHYYIEGRPHVAPVATVRQGRFFLARGYPDPELGAVALNVRLTAGELDGLTWKTAFSQVFDDRSDFFSWRVERERLPKCVIAGYRVAEQRAVRAFTTVTEALAFLPLDTEYENRLQVATMRIRLTADDAFRITSGLPSASSRMWDSALDHVLHGRVPHDEGHLMRRAVLPGNSRELHGHVMASLELAGFA